MTKTIPTLWAVLWAAVFMAFAGPARSDGANPIPLPVIAQAAPAADATPPPAEEAKPAETAPAEEATAEEAPKIDTGDTAWIITAAALVLFMTLPGLALFYGGLVRSKNVLSVLMQCFGIASVITVLWFIYGYSVAFNGEGMVKDTVNLHSFFGGLGGMFLKGLTPDSVAGTIPEAVFVMFQMTFAIITPALIVGAFAERMRFSAVLVFSVIWFTFSYLPVCHMAWAGDLKDTFGLFGMWGVLDFAGGTVVHINAGIAGLVACIMVGKRLGYGKEPMPPHSVVLTLVGAAMLWVGWFGFNAGSALGANGVAGMAMLVTQIATGTAAATWMFVEWMSRGKPTAVGIATGAVAGLVAITPASGSAGPVGGIIIGFASAFICYLCATKLKAALGYDDSLDVFGVHGVGGIVGAVLTGVCASSVLGGAQPDGYEMGNQVFQQIKSVVVTVLWSGVVSVIALKIADVLCGLRPTTEVETGGLDLAEHGEEGYNH